MAEQIPLTPEQQHNSAQRILHDAELIKGGGVVDHLGHLSITGDQYSELHGNITEATVTSQPKAPEQPAIASPETQAMSPERLREIVDSSIYVAAPYVEGYELVRYVSVNKDANVHELAQDSMLGEMYKPVPSQDIEKPFTDEGVSELVTIGDVRQTNLPNGPNFEDDEYIELKGAKPDEPAYMVQYMTLTGREGQKKFRYREARDKWLTDMSDEEASQKLNDYQKAERQRALEDPDRRRMSEFNYTMLLPESLAKELEASMKANPEVARELGDMLVLNPKGARQNRSQVDNKSWETWKPPYEEWREANGGVAKMAFRTNDKQSIAESQVVEF